MTVTPRSLAQLLCVRELAFGSADYRAALALREEVLRRPLGRDLTSVDTEGESAHLHFGAFAEQQLLGCVLLKPLELEQVKLRQMAVAPAAHGRGVGRALVLAAEAAARDHGFTEVVLSARQSAIGFYQRLGYGEAGPVYLELNLPHILMRKSLA